MAKEAATKTRRYWTPKEEDELVACLKDLEGTVFKQNNVFKGHYLKELEKKLAVKLPGSGILAQPHIESKMKTWKVTYGQISTILTYSGISWDDQEKMIKIDVPEVWNELILKDATTAKLKGKSFRLYDKWVEIYGNDRATGEFAETPADMADMGGNVENLGVEDTEKIGDEECVEVEAMTEGKKKKVCDKKRKRRSGADFEANIQETIKQVVGQFTQETSKSMDLLATRIGADFDASEKRQKVNSVVRSLGLLKAEEFRATNMICREVFLCDIFMSLEETDRAPWVRDLLDGKL